MPSVNGLTITVNGATLPGSSACEISWIRWNWGDGSPANGTRGFPATHTYSAAGNYHITGTTYQSDGQNATASISVTVPSTTSVTVENSTTTQLSCLAPTITLGIPTVYGPTVTVNGATLPGSSACSITSISWSWGDGFSSTGWFPASHTYGSAGTYTITVTTHQSDGQTASATTTVQVS